MPFLTAASGCGRCSCSPPPTPSTAITTPRSKGIPKDFSRFITPFDYNDLGSLDRAFDEHHGQVAAVIMEPVISSGGFIMPPIGWLKAVRKICDDLEVLMIADEVITGFGRTGRWFGVEHDGVVPDIMSVAKGITSGYVPLSAAIARRKLADAFPEDAVQENVHPNTYAAHPVACAAGLANLQIMQKDNLVENADAMGKRLLEGLRSAVGASPIIGEVRGRGLMVCAEFVEPDGSGKPLDKNRVAQLDQLAWDRGAIVYARNHVLRLAPPLCITAAEVDQLVAMVADSINAMEKASTR